jgi:adenylyltransferase/sulfurtransferase
LPPLVEPASDLTVDEVRRYSRHIIIPDVGMDGQKRLKHAKVLVIGAGGLGSPTLLYLAAAGAGTLGIIWSLLTPLLMGWLYRTTPHFER